MRIGARVWWCIECWALWVPRARARLRSLGKSNIPGDNALQPDELKPLYIFAARARAAMHTCVYMPRRARHTPSSRAHQPFNCPDHERADERVKSLVRLFSSLSTMFILALVNRAIMNIQRRFTHFKIILFDRHIEIIMAKNNIYRRGCD